MAELKRRERRTDSLFGLGASAALAGPLSFSSSAKKRPSSESTHAVAAASVWKRTAAAHSSVKSCVIVWSA